MRPLLATALLLASSGAARAATGPGVTAGPVLTIPVGARAMGMGGAFTAIASDASGPWYNPAGLARLNAQEAAFGMISGTGELKLQHFAYGGPLPFSGISGSGYSSLGASVLAAQAGKIEVNTLRSDGSLGTTETLSAASDLVATAGYAERVGTLSWETDKTSLTFDHFAGVSGKMLRSTLVERYTATAWAGDAGYLLHVPELGWSFGASALNLGGRLRYVEEEDPLPTTFRGGAAWQGSLSAAQHLLAGVDGDYLLEERRWGVNAGLEYFVQRTYGARVGWRFHQDDGGLTAGVGLRWKGRFLFDYAWALGGEFGASHRFTVTARFGGVPPSRRARARRPFIESVPEREQLRDLPERRPDIEPARPRRVPRERSSGVPGWIY